jgi:hypothetical protein
MMPGLVLRATRTRSAQRATHNAQRATRNAQRCVVCCELRAARGVEHVYI